MHKFWRSSAGIRLENSNLSLVKDYSLGKAQMPLYSPLTRVKEMQKVEYNKCCRSAKTKKKGK